MAPKMTRLQGSGPLAAEGRRRSLELGQTADAHPLVVAVAVGVLVADVRLGRVVAVARHLRPVAHPFSCTACPPNSLRSAASTLPLKVSSCRERKRMNRADGDRRHRHAVLDGLLDRPASLARVLDVAGDLLQARVLAEGVGGQLQKPAAHHAAVVPEVGDSREVEVLVGRPQQLEALGVRLHHAVLDAVVDHLHEVPRAVATGVARTRAPAGPACAGAARRGRRPSARRPP